MRPSPDSDRPLLLARWSVFAVVLLAAIVAFFVLAPKVTPLARTVAP